MALQAPFRPSGSRPRAFLERQITSSSLRFVSFTSYTSSFSYTASAMANSRLNSLSPKQRSRSLIPKGAESANVATAVPLSGDRMLVCASIFPDFAVLFLIL